MVEQGVIVLPRDLNAPIEVSRSLQLDQFPNFDHRVLNASDGRVLVAFEFVDKQHRLLEKADRVRRSLDKELVQQVAAPLYAVLDLAGEAS